MTLPRARSWTEQLPETPSSLRYRLRTQCQESKSTIFLTYWTDKDICCLIHKHVRCLSGKTPNLVVLKKITYVQNTNTACISFFKNSVSHEFWWAFSLSLSPCDRIAHCDHRFQPQCRRSHIFPAVTGGTNHTVGLPCPSSSSASMASSKKSCPKVTGATFAMSSPCTLKQKHSAKFSPVAYPEHFKGFNVWAHVLTN